jgi:hypothetical protein
MLGIPHADFENEMATLKREVGASQDSLTGAHLRELTRRYKEIYSKVEY